MSRLLGELLGENGTAFSQSLTRLESAAAGPGIDVRLTAEIIGSVQQKSRALGLDPNDTTAGELYHVLLNRAAQDDAHLALSISAHNPADFDVLLPLIAKKVKQVMAEAKLSRSVWALKKTTAKKLLKDMPPPKLMAQLRYHSIDSMLKRENISEIYGVLRCSESADWLKRFNKNYKQLSPTDFETRELEIIPLGPKRWSQITDGFVRQQGHHVAHMKEMGVVLLVPSKAAGRTAGRTLSTTALTLHYINEIRLYSAFFKLQQVKPQFGKILVETLNLDPAKHAVMAGHDVHWRVIQRYFGMSEADNLPEMFEPHIQMEDLSWQKPEVLLSRIDPELSFWQGLDFVAAPDGQRGVSFNLIDVALNYANNLPYGRHIIAYFQAALWNELYTRYMGEQILEGQVRKQLDNNMADSSIARGLEGVQL